MDGKMLARIGAVVFVAIAITATAIEMTRKETETRRPLRRSRR
jgi:conjugative transfer region protein TrbK